MSRYIINGGKPLQGEVSIRGAKNASFKEIIASLLTSDPCLITNLPQISDVRLTTSIATQLGSVVEPFGQHSLKIHTPTITSSTIPSGTGEKSRTSFIFAGPLLARTGQITFPSPGGDKLGNRPLDRLFECLTQMGVVIKQSSSSVSMTADKLIGTNYTFPKPSHTSTEVILMVACLAHGQTVINNAAKEPEIDDLISMLNSMGADIQRDIQDTSTIYIQGVKKLTGTNHQVISDRNETVTFACAALSTKGNINILRTNPEIVKKFLETISVMGAQVSCGKDEISIAWTNPLKAINIETEPEPGFMTDWQAVFSLVLTQAVGCSQVVERVFPYRFQHIDTLNAMGAKTKFFHPDISDPENYYHFNLDNDKTEYFHGVKIYGPTKLQPVNLQINDLRAGATATLAAITAQGQSVIKGVEFIERGYEKLAERLVQLGADIKYIKES